MAQDGDLETGLSVAEMDHTTLNELVTQWSVKLHHILS